MCITPGWNVPRSHSAQPNQPAAQPVEPTTLCSRHPDHADPLTSASFFSPTLHPALGSSSLRSAISVPGNRSPHRAPLRSGNRSPHRAPLAILLSPTPIHRRAASPRAAPPRAPLHCGVGCSVRNLPRADEWRRCHLPSLARLGAAWIAARARI